MAKNEDKGKGSQAAGQGEQKPAINYVMMRRITDGDGPHPIHPDEVENYRRGDWVEVEVEPQD